MHAAASFESWERALTHELNCRWTNAFWDDVLPLVMDKEFSVPLFAGVLLACSLWNRRRALRAFLTAAAAWGLCMGLASAMWAGIERPRPWREHAPLLRTTEEIATCADTPGSLVVRGHASRRPGFPSRHALSAGAFAATLGCTTRWLGAVGWIYALLVALARVYAGVHWPSDVLAGLVLGGFVAWGTWHGVPRVLALRGHRHWVEDPPPEAEVARG